MKTQINLAEAEDKVVLGHLLNFDSSQLLLVFYDNTFAAVTLNADHENIDFTICLSNTPIDFDDYDPKELDRLGLQTKEERRQLALEREAKNKQRVEAAERMHLDVLIKKYGVPK